MNHDQPRCFLAGLLLAMLAACVACSASAPDLAPTREYVPVELELGKVVPVVSESRIDSSNRYRSAVRLRATFLGPYEEEQTRTCSGVVLHPRLVLTAGHCVCHERKPVPPEASDTTVTDPSTCAKTATVMTTVYKQGNSPEEGVRFRAEESRPYSGKVLPHEDMRIIYRRSEGPSGRKIDTEFSRADLAVLILDEPLRGPVEYARLAEDPIQLGERIILVGYGPESEEGGEPEKDRRHGENEVLAIKSDGSTFHVGRPLEVDPIYRGEKPGLVRKRGSYLTQGDSGGPCFRERKGALELVGIAKSSQGPPVVLSVYTSTYKYLGWLREKIKAAEKTNTD